jgi:hypothetical protein
MSYDNLSSVSQNVLKLNAAGKMLTLPITIFIGYSAQTFTFSPSWFSCFKILCINVLKYDKNLLHEPTFVRRKLSHLNLLL